MPLKLSEADIEKQITSFLALDGWRALKTNPCSDKARGKGFGEVGMADVLYIRYGSRIRAFPWSSLSVEDAADQVMWIEHKSGDKKATQHQREWHAAERWRGALVVVANEDFKADLESFQEWYRGSGLLRRAGL